jgi:hypothetical protein
MAGTSLGMTKKGSGPSVSSPTCASAERRFSPYKI